VWVLNEYFDFCLDMIVLLNKKMCFKSKCSSFIDQGLSKWIKNIV
jgi:hypothetical protein